MNNKKHKTQVVFIDMHIIQDFSILVNNNDKF